VNGQLDPKRLRSVYILPNVNPSDRYVQTPHDSSRLRLPPNGSGFDNMVLAGDWTDYGFNLGCFEGAVVSGRMAANALGGTPRKILREILPSTPPGSPGTTATRYVEHNPPQTMSGPIVFPNVAMWAFLLRGEVGALTRLCRRFFEAPTAGRVTFAPLSQAVVMTISELPNAYFADRPDLGRATEREVAIGIPGEYASYDAAGKLAAKGIATFMPYLFVDNPVALMTGREVLGYFKQLGEVGLPGRVGGREDFFLNVFGSERLDADAEWGERRLLTVTARDGQVRSDPRALREQEGGNDQRSSVVPQLQGILRAWANLNLPGQVLLALGNLRGLLSGSASQIFLKQLRVEGSGDAAAYQAVVMAEYAVTRIRSVKPTQSYDIAIKPLASLPLATELGLQPQTTERGFAVNFDMTLSVGRLLWRA
jgi:hypothetical protein